MGTVLDYSNWRPPSPQALVDHGVTGVMRYVAPAAWRWPKAITRAELDGLLSVGLSVGFNFEKNPADFQGGHQAGQANGSAIAVAMAELGMQLDVPVFVSFDTEIPTSQFALALDYLHGVKSMALGRQIDGYGENALLEDLAALGGLQRGWMSESTSFPGNAAPTAHTVLQQHFGQQIAGLPGAYDMNTIIKPDWGQYPRPTVHATTKVAPMFDPPIGPIAGVWETTGVVNGQSTKVVLAAVNPDGSVYAFGVPYRDWPNRIADMHGQKAAQIGPAVEASYPRYRITLTDGSTYEP